MNEFQKKLPKVILELAVKYKLSLPEHANDNDKDFWSCHGNWILKHDGCEKIANKENIVFDVPSGNMDVSPNVALLISGRMCILEDDGTEIEVKEAWSLGEACARNTKMPYWWAMAEKRGKDRVVLKLINAYEQGIYSSTEADEWNQMAKSLDKSKQKDSVSTEPAGVTDGASTDDANATTTEQPSFDDDDIPF